MKKTLFRTLGIGFKFHFNKWEGYTNRTFVKHDGHHYRSYLHPGGPLEKAPVHASVTDLGIEPNDSVFVAIGSDGQPTQAIGPCTHEEAIFSVKRHYETVYGGTLTEDDLETIEQDGEWKTADGARFCVLTPDPFKLPKMKTN